MSPEIIASAKHHLEDLLTFFGVNTEVDAAAEDDTLHLSVDSDSTGRLIGHRGETLAAMQYLINMMIRRETTERIYVHVDIAGYKKGRITRMLEKAHEAAARVLESGEEESLPPMNAAERRQVHSELAKLDGLATESHGVDPHRRLVIRKAD